MSFGITKKEVGDGRAVWIYPKIFTYSIVIGPSDDKLCYDEHWCYETKQDAEVAFQNWDPLKQREPEGWVRHPMTGRRRPNGDPSKEYISF